MATGDMPREGKDHEKKISNLSEESRSVIEQLSTRLYVQDESSNIEESMEKGRCIICDGGRVSMNFSTGIIYCHVCGLAYTKDGVILDRYQ